MIGDTEDEYRRLLYVAMTRAADSLIVGGCLPGDVNVRPLSWYDLITKELAGSAFSSGFERAAIGQVKHYTRPRGDRAVGRSRCCAIRTTAADGAAQLAADPGAAGVRAESFVRPSHPPMTTAAR